MPPVGAMNSGAPRANAPAAAASGPCEGPSTDPATAWRPVRSGAVALSIFAIDDGENRNVIKT